MVYDVKCSCVFRCRRDLLHDLVCSRALSCADLCFHLPMSAVECWCLQSSAVGWCVYGVGCCHVSSLLCPMGSAMSFFLQSLVPCHEAERERESESIRGPYTVHRSSQPQHLIGVIDRCSLLRGSLRACVMCAALCRAQHGE